MNSARVPEHLLLFDIDATLLLTGGVGMRSMKQAGADILGPRLSWDGIEPSGGLDPLLLREAARRSDLELDPRKHDTFRARYAELLEKALDQRPASVRAMPGVHELLQDLRRRPTTVLGLLTGNYPRTGALKLQAVGVNPSWFELKVFGDEAESRPGLVRVALEKHAAAWGSPIAPERVVVIGDTPRDVDAALQNGCLALGVATGRFTVNDLLDAGAHAAALNLEDPSPLWRLLDGEGET